MEDDLYRQGFRNTVFNYIGRIGSSSISFLVAIYVLNRLSRVDYGLFSLLFSILASVSLLASCGVPSVIQRYLPEYFRSEKYLIVKRLILSAVLIQLITGGILIGFLLVFRDPLSERVLKSSQILYYLPLFSIVIIVSILIKLLRAVLSSLLMQWQENVFLLLFSVIQAFLYYVALHLGYGLMGLVFSAVISNTFLLFLYSFTIFWKISPLSRVDDDEGIFKRIYRYGLISYFNELSYGIFEIHIDLFVIAYFLASQEAVALYAFAAVIPGRLIDVIPSKMGDTVIAPIFISRYTRNKDNQELCYLFQLLNKFIVFFLFPLITILFCMGDKMLALVVPKYAEVLNIFLMFALFHSVNAIAFSTGTIWQVLEKPQVGFYSRIFVIYNLAMDIILVQYWGIMGVALATGSALIFKAVLQFILTRRYIDIRFPLFAFLKIGINSFAMGVVILLLRQFVVGIISLLVVVIIGGIIYFIVSYFNKVLNEQDRTILNRIAGRSVFQF